MTGQREHGTRACYVFGPEPGRGAGCRCEPCTVANRAGHNRRNRLTVYGQWQPYTDAGPVRQHVKALQAAGLGRRAIANRAGVAPSVVANLLYGRPGRQPTRRVRPATAAAILAVRPGLDALAGKAHVDSTGTRRRLQALVAVGYTQTALAGRLSMTPTNFGAMLQRPAVTAATARAVVRLYDELWDEPPTGAQRGVALARRYAERHGWPPPLAWDEDAIDDPAATPAEDWQRPVRKTWRSADLADEVRELAALGHDRHQAAERLGVSTDAIDKALSRAATPPASTEEDSSVHTFNPVPRTASEFQRGAAFGVQTFYRQYDAGLDVDRIQETHDAAKVTLEAAARNDGEREFCDGFAAAVDTRIGILRKAEDARAELEAWEAECEREAG